MKKSSFLAGFFALTTLVSGGIAWKASENARLWEERNAFTTRQLFLAQEDRDRLAEIVEASEEKAREERNRLHRATVEKQTAALRALPFLKPVVYKTFKASDIPAILDRKLKEKMSREQMDDYFRGLHAIGLLPADYTFADYASLLEEQILAFYDDSEGKVYLAEGIDLDSTYNRMILAHELTHALQDQHYNLSKFLSVRDNDDHQVALMSVLEGDAMLVMGEWLQQYGKDEGTSEILLRSLQQNYDKLLAAPPYVRESLLFSYVKGSAFLSFEAPNPLERDRIFREPPTTTLQVIDPTRYPSRAYQYEWQLGGEKPDSTNSLGALGIQSLITQWANDKAFANLHSEWVGDNYLFFKKDNSLVWVSRWATKEAADTFEGAMRQIIEKRYKERLEKEGGEKNGKGTAVLGGGAAHSVRVHRPSVLEVAYIDAPSVERASALEKLPFYERGVLRRLP